MQKITTLLLIQLLALSLLVGCGSDNKESNDTQDKNTTNESSDENKSSDDAKDKESNDTDDKDSTTPDADTDAENKDTENKEEDTKKYLVLPAKKYYYIDYETEDDLKEVIEYEYNEKNQVIKTTKKDREGNVISTTEYKYDDMGNETSYISRNKDGKTTYHIEYEFNDKGICTKYAYSFSDNFPEEVEEYDDNGNLIRKEDIKYNSVSEYTYDEKNRELTYKSYDDGKLTSESTTTYDDTKMESVTNSNEEGAKVVTTKKYDKNGNVLRSDRNVVEGKGLIPSHLTESEYDDKGNEIHSVITNEGNVLEEYFWTYDDNNNVLEYIWKENNYQGLVQRRKEVRTFDSENRPLTLNVYLWEETEPNEIESFTYDENGNTIEHKHKKDSVDKTVTYTYDEKNGLVKEVEETKRLSTDIYVYENIYIPLEE